MSAPSGRVVTFYSYKGGTGRSMALANVAWVLASSGARVLVIDWDLEAPGLHRYFRPFLADKELARDESEGLIDFMVDFAQRLATPDPAGTIRDAHWFEKYADLGKWSRRLLWPSGEDARTDLGGTIDFVPAGRQGPGYANRVNSFDWASFYRQYNGGAFIDAMRRKLLSRYDWVLIDSRTGVSDTSGICTMQLPDILVVCFTLNYQSIDGAAAVAASARRGRKQELRILPLPTRLDGNEEKLLKAMMQYARRAFDPLMEPDLEREDREKYWHDMGVPYFSRYAYSEKLAPFEFQVNVSTSTLPSMERVASYITDGKVNRLEPLPEEHRGAALAEFEQLPDVDITESPRTSIAKPNWAVYWKRVWYRLRNRKNLVWSVANVALMVLIIYGNLQYRRQPAATSVDRQILVLVADAQKDLQSGRREHAALLIAEAVGRLDPATVVGPDGDLGKQVYGALVFLQPFLIDTKPAEALAISPDGQQLATTGPHRVTSLFRFPPQGPRTAGLQSAGSLIPAGYSAAAFSPDSHYLAAGGREGSLLVVDTAAGKRVWQMDDPDPNSAWVNATSFSPNGSFVAAGTDTGTVMIASVDPWVVLKRFRQPKAVRLLAFSPDSEYVASACDDGIVRVWSSQVGNVVKSFGPYKGSVSAISFVPTSNPIGPPEIAIATGDGRLLIGPQPRNDPTWITVDDELPPPIAFAFSPDANLLAAGGNSTKAFLWRPKTVGQAVSLPSEPARALAFSGDAKLIAIGTTGGVVLWDPATNEMQKVSSLKKSDTVNAVAFSPDGKFVAAASTADTFTVFAPKNGKPPTFSAWQVRNLACSQATDQALSAQDWKRYFGSEPLRYTCEAETTGATGASGATGGHR